MTMHRVPNYGSFMQALSLKRMIELLGHEVIFIDYKVDPDIEHRKNIKSMLICKKNLMAKRVKGTKFGGRIYYKIKSYSHSQNIVEKQKIFASCNEMLGITEQYHFRSKVDVLVIGSDEVFNCTQLGYNVGYSLELFGKNCRAERIITYAASFGSTTFSKLSYYGVTTELSGFLNNISALSVRDANSQFIVKKLCNKDVERHLDPVLVGNVETLFEKEPQCNNYIILYGYTYRFTKEECKKIMEFAHSCNKLVIAVGEPQYESDEYICCKPDEVLGYFKKADMVITDTFHGTIFSVITHKKFLTVIRSSQKGVSGNQEKLECLLKDLNLENRQLSNFECIGKIHESINYERVDKIRDVARKEALEYLIKNICKE